MQGITKLQPRQCLLFIGVWLLLCYLFCLPRQLFHCPYSTVVVDCRGELLGARVAADGQWRFPPRHTVPDKMRQCLLTFEDHRFYYHFGVDPLAMMRAICLNLKQRRIVSGGSTLTMQTIRLMRGEERTLTEKLNEMIWATRLELRATKEEILALYLSHAPFGGNVVGIDAAAWRYFGHPADDLSWAEAATLAVLPNSPAMIHLAKSRTALLAKRNRLLKRLYQQGVMDTTTYTLAIEEPLPDAPHPLPQIAPHLVDRYRQEHPGEYITSTIDKSVQQQVEALAERWSDEFARSDIRNLAVLVIDLHSGHPLAYCGNVHYERRRGAGQVDILQAPRSTGSILKPFLYAVMLQEGELLPHMLLPDVPVNINGFSPQNFDRHFEGAVPADEALARSLNIPAVEMLQRHSVPKFLDLLQQLDMTTFRQPASHYGLSLILGGGEATLWEVTRAYANMGRTLLQLPPIDGGKEMLHAGAVWQTFEALKEKNVAWKTGTSYGFRDAWAVGVTPRYAVGIWVGNATGEGKPGLVGARTAGPVLFDVFNLLPRSHWFERPVNQFVDATICRRSGMLAGRLCEEKDTALILPAGRNSEVCPYHQRINGQSWFTLPPVQEWFYRQYHPEYQPIPPAKPDSGDELLRPMQFIYPTMNARITLPRQLDGSQGTFTAELAHRRPQSMVYWHLDNQYLMQTQDFHRIKLQPAPGKHSLTAVDEEGNTVSVTFVINNSAVTQFM
ncbi:MAG: penicillin-binding protein 1C [Prevotellaceae bacterium]|jgi:penicillin-binding protein 1C|nr:penicillin-binding protein 1C [Prevotellaceae bacterium]